MFRELVATSKERMMSSSHSKAYDFNTELIFSNIVVFEERLVKVNESFKKAKIPNISQSVSSLLFSKTTKLGYLICTCIHTRCHWGTVPGIIYVHLLTSVHVRVWPNR